MSKEKTKDDKEPDVIRTTRLTPTQFVKVTCSCGHPMLSQSNDAFQAAREDHLTAVHRPKRID